MYKSGFFQVQEKENQSSWLNEKQRHLFCQVPGVPLGDAGFSDSRGSSDALCLLTLLLSHDWLLFLLSLMGFLSAARGEGGVVVDTSRLLFLQPKVKEENDLPWCQYVKS